MLIKPGYKKFWNVASVGSKAAAAAPYVGPGDIVTFLGWWGLRAYTAAYATAGSPIVDLVDQAGANPITINSLLSGALDIASINTWVTAHAVTTIKVTKLYDQVSTRHATQATLASMPVLTLNASGLGAGRPCLTYAGSQVLLTSNIAASVQPYSFSWAGKRVSGTSYQCVMGQGSGAIVMGFNNSADNLLEYAGILGAVLSATDNNWYAVENVINGASSTFFVNGTGPTTVPSTAGGGSILLDTLGLGAANDSSIGLNGTATEFGWLNSTISSGNQSTLNSNKKTYWGF